MPSAWGIDPELFQPMTSDYTWMVTADPIPADAVERAEQAIAECPAPRC